MHFDLDDGMKLPYAFSRPLSEILSAFNVDFDVSILFSSLKTVSRVFVQGL